MPDLNVTAELAADDGGTTRPVNVGPGGDFDPTAYGAATEVTLAALLVELAQKLGAGDLAALEAIAAAQDTKLSRLPASGAASETTLSAIATALSNRYGGGKTAKTVQVTDAGQTVVHTPAPGTAVRLFWVSAINDPDAAATPRIRIGFETAGDPDWKYAAAAVAHWELFTGDVDRAVVVELDQAGDVAVTLHYQEI